MSNLRDSIHRLKIEYEAQNAPDGLKDRLQSVMARQARKQGGVIWLRRIGGSAVAAVLALGIVTNASATAAEALADIPVLGALVGIITFREYEGSENGVEIKLRTPHLTGLGDEEAEREINEQFDQYADEVVAQYEADVAAIAGLGEGHESIESTYKVYVESDRQLTIGINTTILMASSMQYNTFYNIDKTTGKLVPLSGLFRQGADYVGVITREIMRQMREQMEDEDCIGYFLDTGMPGVGFSAIREDQPYYVDEDGNLVVSFDEYEVASGAMGAVTFTLPPGLLSDILLEGGLLDQ